MSFNTIRPRLFYVLITYLKQEIPSKNSFNHCLQKHFLFRVKKFFDSNFLQKSQKKREKWLCQKKVGMLIGKVKKYGIVWFIPHRMAADNANRGPPGWNRVTF